MFSGLPGGSPGSDASTGCGGLFIIAAVSLVAVALFVALLFYATGDLGMPN